MRRKPAEYSLVLIVRTDAKVVGLRSDRLEGNLKRTLWFSQEYD
jgi:hypothetical protein